MSLINWNLKCQNYFLYFKKIILLLINYKIKIILQETNSNQYKKILEANHIRFILKKIKNNKYITNTSNFD